MVIAERPISKPKPFTYAPITIVEGEQKSGKSNFCVARMINATYSKLDELVMPSGEIVKASPVLNNNNFAVIGYAKIWTPNAKIIKVPPHSILRASRVRLFANLHLKGVKYAYMPLVSIIEHLNDGSITGLSDDNSVDEAFLFIDEAYLALDRRDGLSPLTKAVTKMGYQIAKRHLNVMFALPEASVLDLRTQGIETEHVICSFDEDRQEITASIKARKKYKQPRDITYDARQYYKYYNADEQHALSNQTMTRALEAAR